MPHAAGRIVVRPRCYRRRAYAPSARVGAYPNAERLRSFLPAALVQPDRVARWGLRESPPGLRLAAAASRYGVAKSGRQEES
jgi:hypothetical protein